eukprot:gene15109-23084_t
MPENGRRIGWVTRPAGKGTSKVKAKAALQKPFSVAGKERYRYSTWKKAAAECKRLRERVMACRAKGDAEAARKAQERALQVGCTLLGVGSSDGLAWKTPLVSAWDAMLVIVGAWQKDAEVRPRSEDVTEVCHAVFPFLLHRVALFWIDATRGADDLLVDLYNAFSTDFLSASDHCGVGSLITALLPFDPVLWHDHKWLQQHAKTLATSLEPDTTSVISLKCPDMSCLLTSFYCRACPAELLFRHAKHRRRFVLQPSADDPALSTAVLEAASHKSYLLVRPVKTSKELVDVLAGQDATSSTSGLTGIVEVEKLILAYADPRTLRTAENVCRAWADICFNTPRFRYHLHLGAFVRNRFVRFFEESWGDETLNTK